MTRFRFFAVLCLLILHASGETQLEDAVLGQWEIQDVFCRGVDVVDRSEIGLVITFTREKAVDPIAGGESGGKIGYREVQPDAALRKSTAEKINPLWAKRGTKLRWVAVTRDGLDFILLVVLPDGSLVHLEEGDTCHRLVRRKPR